MAKSAPKRKIRICIWLPPDLHDRLARIAREVERPKAGYVIRALRRALDEDEAMDERRRR